MSDQVWLEISSFVLDVSTNVCFIIFFYCVRAYLLAAQKEDKESQEVQERFTENLRKYICGNTLKKDIWTYMMDILVSLYGVCVV